MGTNFGESFGSMIDLLIRLILFIPQFFVVISPTIGAVSMPITFPEMHQFTASTDELPECSSNTGHAVSTPLEILACGMLTSCQIRCRRCGRNLHIIP
jgi:hypothetical protein